MMTRSLATVLLLSAALLAQAPTAPFSFSYMPAGTQSATPVNVNGTIAFPTTEVGSVSSITLLAANTSNETWRILDASVVGAGFSVASGTLTIPGGESRSLVVSMTPRQGGALSGVLAVRMSGPSNQPIVVNFSLAGLAPNPGVTLTYSLAGGGFSQLANGATLRFPSTQLGARVTANFVISNRTGAATVLSSATLTGDSFELTDLPVLPAELSNGGEIRFAVNFTPVTRANYFGRLVLTFGDTQRVVLFEGEGAAGTLLYQVLTQSGAATVNPEDTIEFGSTAVDGGPIALAMRIRNVGNAQARITSVAISGTYYQIADLPALPIVLAAGESITFTLAFAPRDTGVQTGRLRVDGVQFALSGTGLGEKIVTTIIAGEVRTVMGGPAVGFLPNTPIGDQRAFQVEISNQGNVASAVSAVGLTGDGFSFRGLPSLPVRLEPGGTLLVNAVFTPSTVGTTSGVLQVQDKTYPIRGVGSEPPAVPAVRFVGLPERAGPLEQPAFGIELAETYPYALTGKVTMTFTTEAVVNDPAIQFVTGSRVVDFRIPAGATRAIFPQGSNEVRYQTGSLAGVLTFTATFLVGTFDLTRAGAPSQNVSLPGGPPAIRAVEVISRSTASFELAITGVSTTRSVQRLNFEFTPAQRANLQTTKLSTDVERSFDAWFQSVVSRDTGGQFMVTVRFDLTGGVNAVESVAVTASNTRGTSDAKSVKLSE